MTTKHELNTDRDIKLSHLDLAIGWLRMISSRGLSPVLTEREMADIDFFLASQQPEGFTHFPELLESVQQMDAMLKADGAQGEREAFEAWWESSGLTKFKDTAQAAWEARAALAQSSPKPEPRLVECDACPTSGGCVEVCMKTPAQPSPAPELASFQPWEAENIAFVLRNIGALEAEDIDGDNVDLRFEDANGRDTACDVSIVEYAEKAADLIEAMLRIATVAQAGQVPDHAEFLDWAEKVLNEEQERLSGEDYLMDSNDCIAALREAAAPAQGE